MSSSSTPPCSYSRILRFSLPARWQETILPLALTLLLSLSGQPVRAFDGLTLSVLANPPVGQPLVLDLRGTYPIATIGSEDDPLQLSVRTDVLTDFQTTPALLAGLSLSDGGVSELWGLERYLAAGAGLGFAPAPLQSPYALTFAAAGARLPIVGGFGAQLELGVGSAAGVVRPSVALGVSYRFGGTK